MDAEQRLERLQAIMLDLQADIVASHLALQALMALYPDRQKLVNVMQGLSTLTIENIRESGFRLNSAPEIAQEIADRVQPKLEILLRFLQS